MAKKTKKTKKSTQTKIARKTARSSTLSDLPANQLARELQKRTRTLQRKRDRLQAQLEEVESQIAELEPAAGGGGGRGRPRQGRRRRLPRNQQPLPEVMASVMDKKTPMGPAEIAEAVQKAGL